MNNFFLFSLCSTRFASNFDSFSLASALSFHGEIVCATAKIDWQNMRCALISHSKFSWCMFVCFAYVVCEPESFASDKRRAEWMTNTVDWFDDLCVVCFNIGCDYLEKKVSSICVAKSFFFCYSFDFFFRKEPTMKNTQIGMKWELVCFFVLHLYFVCVFCGVWAKFTYKSNGNKSLSVNGQTDWWNAGRKSNDKP